MKPEAIQGRKKEINKTGKIHRTGRDERKKKKEAESRSRKRFRRK